LPRDADEKSSMMWHGSCKLMASKPISSIF
jgi:hypothetical protein